LNRFRDEHVVVVFGIAVAAATIIMDAPADITLFILGGYAAIGIVVYHLISGHREMHECIASAKKDWESTFDIINDAITIHDKEFNIVRANKAATELLGMPFYRILSTKCYKSYHGTAYPPDSCPSCKTLATGVPSITETYEANLKKHLEIKALPRYDKDNRINGVVHIVRDISKRVEAEEQLRALSLKDDLTGLYNRRGFMTLAEQQQKLASRLKKGFYILFADLDGLKKINDSLGHSEGCRALIDSSLILKQCFRESDIISRIGGDEFAVLAIENNGDRAGEAIIRRLQKRIDGFNARGGCSYKISMSAGIVYCGPDCRRQISDILYEADQLMYEQKKIKKNGLDGKRLTHHPTTDPGADGYGDYEVA